MERIFIALALLITMWAAPAEASQYKGYYYGAKSPQELANHVESALARDPTGKTMLDAAKCRKDGSCAAPINYLESFQAHDPNGGWTMENLVQKMRTLVRDCTVTGKYQMDRIIWKSGPLGRTDVNGMSRSFHKNECAWVNPETSRPVLAQDCANPVGQRIDIDCVVINFQTTIPDEAMVDWQRRRSATDECFTYRQVSQLYEPQFSGTPWQPIRANDLSAPCSFCDYNRTFGYRGVATGTIRLKVGYHQIRIARNEPIDLCLKSWDRGQVRSSFTNGMNWPGDYSLVGREHHARIFYSSDEMEAAEFWIGQPKARLWWASDEAAEARIHASYRSR